MRIRIVRRAVTRSVNRVVPATRTMIHIKRVVKKSVTFR